MELRLGALGRWALAASALAMVWACGQPDETGGGETSGSPTAGSAELSASSPEPTPQTPPLEDEATSADDAIPHGGMVAAAHPLAVEAGLDMLRAGGSAVDAAVAVQAVLGLVQPQSSGLGGGAFLIHFDARTGVVSAYDGRERAPAAATPELFLDDSGAPIGFVEAKHSGLSTGVPGVVDMLALAHGDHGVLEWPDLFGPGVRLAREGFPISATLNASLTRMARFVAEDPRWLGEYLYTDGEPMAEGATVTNPDYAETLEAIAANPRALLEGPIAEAIIEAVQAEPRAGLLTLEDLAQYQARRAEPLCVVHQGLTVCGMPSPSSGGVTVAHILGLVERVGFVDGGADNPENWRRFVEIQRLAYADRDRYFGDTDYVDVPLDGLLADSYLDERATFIAAEGVMDTATPGNPWAHQSGAGSAGEDATGETPGTSHFVVVDGEGDVVSMTTTVEGPFGTMRMAGGFVLNNQLTDFSFRAVDDDGVAIANRVEGGKRPRSSMSPTLVLDADGAFVFATGSPGGSRIIAHTAKSLIGVLHWGLTPQEAAALPIIVGRGDVIQVEDDAQPETLAAALEAFGFSVDIRDMASGVHSVLVGEDGALIGAADPRGDGVALAASSGP